MSTPAIDRPKRHAAAAIWGAVIGTLGGLIGLGGAEFRLPVLIGVFRFAALEAVILNKAVSLVVVASAILFRTSAVPMDDVVNQWPIIANLLAGSLLGAWLGASWATRLRSETLYRVISVLLLVIAVVLLIKHQGGGQPLLTGLRQIALGVVAGLGIGVIASLLGVAGGEFLIPTLILLFGVDVKLAGSLSLAISLPTMLMGFARYSRDKTFVVVRQNVPFLTFMAVGSLVGAFCGGLLLGLVPAAALLPLLAAILVLSAIKVWRHARR
ncbi:sulfite exporter TauE/SafE family protein [Steroidobacter sp.]|uniref:sulfite exporter TauE/SafE family protein n=1 Tax=Steroidobacter sp. TaxID=1978227 RepID=UPI0032C2268A